VVDPLEIMAVDDVMRTKITAFPAAAMLAELGPVMKHDENAHGQRLYPVLDDSGKLVGTITRGDIRGYLDNLTPAERKTVPLSYVAVQDPVVAFPDEPLRIVVNRMAASGRTRLPVVEPEDSSQLLGLVGLEDLLKAREVSLEHEHFRERVLRLRLPRALRRPREMANKIS
jgi:CBS domain-containing protein